MARTIFDITSGRHAHRRAKNASAYPRWDRGAQAGARNEPARNQLARKEHARNELAKKELARREPSVSMYIFGYCDLVALNCVLLLLIFS